MNDKNSFVKIGLFVAALLQMHSCGVGDNPSPLKSSGRGSVALFITDNLSVYKQVVSTITGVRLINSGTGSICTVLDNPVTLDISNLAGIAQYTNLAECPQGSYNRIDVDFRQAVHLMDQQGATADCAYTSYSNKRSEQMPLACDPSTGICTISINNAARSVPFLVQEDRYNDLGIDFDLKQFIVTDFGNPACVVNMKAVVVSATDMNSNGRSHGVTGSMQGLDMSNGVFTMLASGVTLTVDYSSVDPALQPNLDTLLQTAWNSGLAVNVLTGGIDLKAGTITANRIFVKTSGTVSNVMDQPQWTFDLVSGATGTIAGSHRPPADVQGAFINNAWVNVKFDGYDDKKAKYLAASIEVLPAGTVLQD